MRNLILFTLSTLAFLIHPLSLPAQNSFSISLDVNSAASDQDVTPDFDGDGMVGFSDFLALSGLFGARQGDGRYEAKYDLDSDGAIGFSDFLIFSASFGKEVSAPDGATQVAIPDASLRAVIAASLGKSIHAPITQAEMATLTRLDAPNQNIRDLTGLEFAINLTELVLGGNEGRLGEVNINELFNNLSLYLTNLIELWINFSFNSSVNSISNVTSISNLINLKLLFLDDNSISNVTPISNLINLIDLDLASNSISDLAPLVANTGLGEGDEVDVSNNPLSATSINIHIPALESRGVEVDFSASKPAVKNKELRMPFRMIEPFGMKKWKVGDNLRKGRLIDVLPKLKHWDSKTLLLQQGLWDQQ